MMQNHHSDKGIWFVIFIIFLFLVGNFIFTQYEINHIQTVVAPAHEIAPIPTLTASGCDASCQSYINNAVNAAIGNLPTNKPTGTTKPAPSPVSSSPKITYIPLTAGQTQNTDWTNISGSQFTLNISDYGNNAYEVWDANLRVDNANGTTFARIFDLTHGIAVNGSEISVSNTSSAVDVVSGGLQFWQGNNNYIIQLKSLNSSTAFLDSGRIKINY